MVEVVLDHDQPVLLQRQSAGPGTDGPAFDLPVRVRWDALRGHDPKDARHVRVEQAQADDLVSDEPADICHDGVENLGEWRAVRDHPLDGRECLEQPLALADLGRLPLAGASGCPLALEQAQVAQRQVHDSSHAAQQGPFLAAERDVANYAR